MAISKLILNGVTQIDLTSDTVAPSNLISPNTAHGADGEPIVGTASGGGTKSATGKYTPSQTYNTTGNRAICTMSDIGFTPSRFYFELDDKANTSIATYMVVYASYELIGTGKAPLRVCIRYTNNTGTVGATPVATAWTTQSNQELYTNGTTIYFRTTANYFLPADVTYRWIAYE